MGAIAGIFMRSGAAPRAVDLAAMSARMTARAPGEDESWVGGSCALVHRNDSVRPRISAQGQPVEDASGRYRIVCSGRIFNSADLERALHAEGVLDAPAPDILSVMLHAYMAWGVDAFRRFNG